MVTNKIINNYESNVLELVSLFLKIFVQHLGDTESPRSMFELFWYIVLMTVTTKTPHTDTEMQKKKKKSALLPVLTKLYLL